jgi:hypothetical protein
MSNCCPSSCLPAKCIAATPRCATTSLLVIGSVTPSTAVVVLVSDMARDNTQRFAVTSDVNGLVTIDTATAPGLFYDRAVLFISIENFLIGIDGEAVECLKVPVKAIRNQTNSVIWKSSQTLQLP